MSDRFRNWLACPACDSDGNIGVLAHEHEFVLECYACGQIAEFTIGEDMPFNGCSVPSTDESTTSATDTRSEESHSSQKTSTD